MIIGIPKEIKNNENRVAMTPAGVHELVKHGHTVLVQKTAGEGSGFSDEDFALVGAVYYAIYDDSGEIDGGWFGYDEDGTWKDFVRFVSEAHHAKVGKRIYPGGGDGFYDIVSMLEDGTDADEIYEECGVPASRSVRSKPKAKPKTVPKAKPRKAPAKTSSDSRRSKAAPKSKPKGKARPAKGVRR